MRTGSTSPIRTSSRRRACWSRRAPTSRRIDDITSDTIVGAEDGTTGETYANDNSEAGEVRGFPSVDDAFNALSVGQVDAVIADGPVVEDAAENKEGLEVVEIFPTDEQYGIVIPEGNDALLEAVNEALQEVKDEGTLDELYEEWIEHRRRRRSSTPRRTTRPDPDSRTADMTHERTEGAHGGALLRLLFADDDDGRLTWIGSSRSTSTSDVMFDPDNFDKVLEGFWFTHPALDHRRASRR